jgi:quercetin dioxygenase-like cupin family protein
MPRPEALRETIEAAEAAFRAQFRAQFRTRAGDPRAQASLRRIFAALRTPGAPGAAPARLPVCDLLPAAAEPGRFADPALRRLAAAILRLDPLLAWRRRPGAAPNASADFASGHANAMIAGPGGLEERGDVWLGLSLLAPHVRYPDHDHPPEETYLVLGPGAFSQGGGPWFEPGRGGSFHNPPGILHAMRAGEAPLLALWALRPD